MVDSTEALHLPFIIKRNPGDILYDSFLKKTLGYFLPQCLRHVSEVRPLDPIDAIARCLYKSVDIHFYQQEKVRYLRDLERANHVMKQAKNKTINRLPPIVEAAKAERDALQKLREQELQDLLHILKNSDEPLDDDITTRLNFLADVFNAQRQVKSLLTERAKRFLADQRKAEIDRNEAIAKAMYYPPPHIYAKPKPMADVMVTVTSFQDEYGGIMRGDFDDKSSLPPLSKRESKEIDQYIVESKQPKETSSSKTLLKKARSSQSRKELEASSSHTRYQISVHDSRTDVIRKAEAVISTSKSGVSVAPDIHIKKDYFGYESDEDIISFRPLKASLSSKGDKEDGDDDEALREFKDIIDKGHFAITKNGLLAYVSKTLGVIAPKEAKFTPFSASDMPEEWLKRNFACESLYDAELYTVCDYGTLDEIYSDVEEISLEEYRIPVIKKLGMKGSYFPPVEDEDEQ